MHDYDVRVALGTSKGVTMMNILTSYRWIVCGSEVINHTTYPTYTEYDTFDQVRVAHPSWSWETSDLPTTNPDWDVCGPPSTPGVSVIGIDDLGIAHTVRYEEVFIGATKPYVATIKAYLPCRHARILSHCLFPAVSSESAHKRAVENVYARYPESSGYIDQTYHLFELRPQHLRYINRYQRRGMICFTPSA